MIAFYTPDCTKCHGCTCWCTYSASTANHDINWLPIVNVPKVIVPNRHERRRQATLARRGITQDAR